MIFDRWVDFVVYPTDPDRVVNFEQRFDVRHAIYTHDIKNHSEEELHRRGGRIVESDILIGDDVFKAMEIGETGSVFIWTRKYVYVLRRDHGNHHRLMGAPRNPPQDEEKQRNGV